jgi:hypothetical protein
MNSKWFDPKRARFCGLVDKKIGIRDETEVLVRPLVLTVCDLVEREPIDVPKIANTPTLCSASTPNISDNVPS